jgi:hypothetical protein
MSTSPPTWGREASEKQPQHCEIFCTRLNSAPDHRCDELDEIAGLRSSLSDNLGRGLSLVGLQPGDLGLPDLAGNRLAVTGAAGFPASPNAAIAADVGLARGATSRKPGLITRIEPTRFAELP